MKLPHLNATLAASLLLSATIEAPADSYRCGRKLVRTGDTSADVLRLCGEPSHRDRGQESVLLDGALTRISVQRWYYRKSKRSLEHIIMLHQGRVIEIAVGGR